MNTEPIRVDHLVPGGEAIATRADGKKVLLWNALPGELVNYAVNKEKAHLVRATATTIIESSDHRIPPRNDCFLSTSPWQIMDYEYELEQKSKLVQETFQQQGIEVSPPSVITDTHDFFYRNKMEYSLYWDNEQSKIRLGFHARNSHRKIPVIQSSIEKPEIFTHATAIIDQLNAQRASARDYQSLLLRSDQQGNISGGLYESGKPHPNFPPLADTILGHRYTYSPNGFFQINIPVYELALTEISKHIATTNVLDLYAGVGTIGLSVARDYELTLVETNKSAFAELARNCTDVPSNPRPVLANSEDSLEFIQPDQTVIIDPPRAGCDPKLIQVLGNTRPQTIVYLSCNPITQARDLYPLIDSDYSLKQLTAYNFFPRTPHIETLAILTEK